MLSAFHYYCRFITELMAGGGLSLSLSLSSAYTHTHAQALFLVPLSFSVGFVFSLKTVQNFLMKKSLFIFTKIEADKKWIIPKRRNMRKLKSSSLLEATKCFNQTFLLFPFLKMFRLLSLFYNTHPFVIHHKMFHWCFWLAAMIHFQWLELGDRENESLPNQPNLT